MVRIHALSLAVAIALTGTAVQGQQSQPGETTPSHTDPHSDGTAPGAMGSTGWTGGSGSRIGTSNSQTTGASTSASSAADQPEMATGLDLKGPPTRFPADKTPE